jgi:hypothetical protein
LPKIGKKSQKIVIITLDFETNAKIFRRKLAKNWQKIVIIKSTPDQIQRRSRSATDRQNVFRDKINQFLIIYFTKI